MQIKSLANKMGNGVGQLLMSTVVAAVKQSGNADLHEGCLLYFVSNVYLI